MKVGNTGTIAPAYNRRRKQPQTAPGGFSEAVQNTDSPGAVFAPADIESMSGLLSIQEISDPADQREQAAKRGKDILAELDALRHGLLTGSYSAEKLTRLISLSRQQAGMIADPRLREVIAEIELRAAVELAKLAQAAD